MLKISIISKQKNSSGNIQQNGVCREICIEKNSFLERL